MGTSGFVMPAPAYQDLIERLRENADLDEMEHANPDVVALEREAADAITQLQQQVADLTAERVAIAKAALEVAAKRAELFCACDTKEVEEDTNFVLRVRAARIRTIDPATIVAKVEGKS